MYIFVKVVLTPCCLCIYRRTCAFSDTSASSLVQNGMEAADITPYVVADAMKPMNADDGLLVAKVILAGPPGVGKTCVLSRYVSCELEMPQKHEPTIGADFRVAEVEVNDVTVTLQIWDTAGDKKVLSIGKSLYKNADGIILIYDISNRATFRALDMYWENFVKHSGMLQSYYPYLYYDFYDLCTY